MARCRYRSPGSAKPTPAPATYPPFALTGKVIARGRAAAGEREGQGRGKAGTDAWAGAKGLGASQVRTSGSTGIALAVYDVAAEGLHPFANGFFQAFLILSIFG